MPECEASSDQDQQHLAYSTLHDDRSSSPANVSIKLDDEATVPSNDYRCTSKMCCCGILSLRTGCILIAALYTLYSMFYIGLIVTFLIMLGLAGSIGIHRFSAVWNLNMAIFEAYFSIFALVFLCLGINKLDYRRILVSKWIMILYLIMNAVITIRFIALDLWPFFIIGLLFFIVLPAMTILCLHSYEAELWQIHRRSAGIPTLLKNPMKDFQLSS